MKAKKFVGPTKRMAEALEAEGLYVSWPDTITDKEDLAIDGTFCVGMQVERTAFIDLRDEGDLSTKANVDAAISNQLEEEYENFSIADEMKMYLEMSDMDRKLRGVPDVSILLEHLKEQEARLKRFAEVAEAVSSGRPVPHRNDSAEITISGKDAKRVCDILEKIAYYGEKGPWNHEEQSFAKMISTELRNKVKGA